MPLSLPRRTVLLGGLTSAAAAAFARKSDAMTSELAAAAADLRLWYDKPADKWIEALPVGNGRLGAMVFGGVTEERLTLNEDTLWSGHPRSGENAHAREVLPRVREAVFAGKYKEAGALCQTMQGPYNESYQPLGELRLRFPGAENQASADYVRELNLDTAIATTRFRIGGVTYTREAFVSAPAGVLVVFLTSDAPGRLTFTVHLDSLLNHVVSTESTELHMMGRCPVHVDPSYLKTENPVIYENDPSGDAMRFACRVRVLTDGGTLAASGDTLTISGASAATLLLSAATSFNGFDRSPGRDGKNEIKAAQHTLDAAARTSYANLKAAHVTEHRSLFRRVSLDLGRKADAAPLPTDARIRAFHQSDDPALATLLYQYGRYLLIASSRPGTQPANLQGIWSDQVRPPWSCNWTLNINAEMNYWPAEVANLSECHAPLFDLIAELARNGAAIAKTNYGCGGWTAHHNTDVWRPACPVGNGGGDPRWANWPLGGAWLATHLGEHFAYGRDKRFLKDNAWPLLKSAAQFGLDWLIEDGKGHLVTNPSTSPENGFKTPDGVTSTVSLACTMDMAILRELFGQCLQAAQALGNPDPAFTARVRATLPRLFPYQVGAKGQLQEWFQDFAEEDPHHRHVSHLFGVYPGHQITPAKTPALANAAKRSLELRGDGGTGWSLGWKINLWARLCDGDHAYQLVRALLTLVETGGTHMTGGGVYANLFDAHPPFQIDGNFAFTSGVSEMLLQSTPEEITLLPALPSLWPTGRVEGLRARGGWTVGMAWESGALTRATLHSEAGEPLQVRYRDHSYASHPRKGETITLDGSLKTKG